MASVTAATLQPGHREQKRKKTEDYLPRKMAESKSRMAGKKNEIRSPLMERSNRVPLKKAVPIKELEKKMVKPINKENLQPVVPKGGKTMTFSQSFLKTRTLKEKQLKDEKLKAEATKTEPKPAAKPILGAYRGKIVQSKINSFRKPSESTSVTTERKAATKITAAKPVVATSRKPLVRPSTVNEVKRKAPPAPPNQPQVRASVSVASKVAPVTNRRTTLTITRAPIQTRVSTSMLVKSKAETVTTTTTRRTTQSVTSQYKTVTSVIAKNKSQHVTVRRTTHGPHHRNVLEEGAQPGGDAVNTAQSQGPAGTAPQGKKRVTIGSVTTAPSRQTRPPRPSESAAERKARLNEWRASKGIVIKRPPLSKALPSSQKLEEPVIKSEPEEPKEEPRQLFWVTMAEEDEQEVFTLKISQIFAECQKLIDEGIPREEILSLLEKQIENIPEAKKLSRYWECLARLEKRDRRLYKVIEVCEEAVAAGAQPLDELRAILADALEQLKTSSENPKKENEEVQDLEPKEEIKEEAKESTVKRKRGRRRAMKYEPQSPTTPEKQPKCDQTPEKDAAMSSVIRFNITTTPHLERMRKLQMQEGDSSIKGYKFLTPVRRSSRLERKVHTFPDMLKDHDPCIAGIAQLEELEDPESCPNAYIFRKNDALKEISAGSLTKN